MVTDPGTPKQALPLAPAMPAPQLDGLDRSIVAALQIQPRASWQQLASAIEVSESTVARRAKRLLSSGAVRIVGLPDPLRCGLGFPVLMQVECAVGAAESVARMLALRPDVRFLSLLTGSHDLVLEIIVPSRAELGHVVVREFNQIPGIARTSTLSVIRNFNTSYDWSRSLLGEKADKLDGAPRSFARANRVTVDDVDRRLIELLAMDGRMSAADLAQDSAVSESSVRRRVEAMSASGAVHFATFVEPTLMGFEAPIFLWLDVDLAVLEQVTASLGAHPEVRYLSATAGYSDLVAEVILSDLDALYRFMTQVVGTLPGIRRSEVSLEISTVKRGYLTESS